MTSLILFHSHVPGEKWGVCRGLPSSTHLPAIITDWSLECWHANLQTVPKLDILDVGTRCDLALADRAEYQKWRESGADNGDFDTYADAEHQLMAGEW